MQDIKLKAAGPAELPIIGQLATRIWNQYYPAIIGQDQVDYMLEKMYSPASLNTQLIEKSHRFYLILRTERPIGFVSIYPENEKEWFISKFYIDQEFAGQGIGQLVFREIVTISRAETIHLTVNRQNFKAINFYFKLGFKIEKVADFDIGQGYVMNDFVMMWLKG